MGDLPEWSRASDIRTLALGSGCQGQWALSHLYDDLPDAVWFILGTSIHTAIEDAIVNELTFEEMLDSAHTDKMMMLAQAGGDIIEQTSKRRKRHLGTVDEDIDRMCKKWWDDVHPSSPTRMAQYDDYDWPPRVEHVIDIDMGDHRLITTVDAIFEGGKRFGEEVAIVDWKSGATKRSSDSQLHTYAYGLEKEGIFDTGSAVTIGWFHHIDHSSLQHVHDYWGDEVVGAQIRATHRAKEGIKENGELVFVPDWICNYCTARSKCPIMGQGDMADIKLRIKEATFLTEPEDTE